jgi:HpcH/HpaI aldolase/citrate lyase family
MHGFPDQAQSARQFAEETPPMENRLQRKLADGALTFSLGVNQPRTSAAAVPGIDGLHIDSEDLCSEMGIPGKYHDPRYLRAVETVGRAARADTERMRTIPVPRI